VHRARPRSGRVAGRRSNGDPREKAKGSRGRESETPRRRRRRGTHDTAAPSCALLPLHAKRCVTSTCSRHITHGGTSTSGVRWHGGTAHMDMDMNMGTWVKHVKPIAASLSTQFQYQFNMYRTCCKDMLATWGWLPRNVRLCARPHTLYVIRPSLRQSETKSARDKMWRVVRPRSSYFPLRSAAPATPGAGSCRSPRRICW
jgi:hypothetical protein